jgi:nucleoid DNA-binding protein
VDITAFIRELLFGHDCVIIPGFGGFIGNYTPASIDRKTGTFYPPAKQISFNRNLNHNDGLLTGRISGAAGITYGDARTMVEEFSAGIRRRLGSGEKVVFDHIGSFVNNQEGNIQFEPDRSANYHLDSFGLEAFRMQPLEGYNVRTRVLKPERQAPVHHLSMKKILWRAAVIVPLLSVLVIVPLKTDLFRARVESSNLNPLVTAEFEQNKAALDAAAARGPEKITVPSDTALAEPEQSPAGNLEVKAAEPVSVPVTEAVTSPALRDESFMLITGSFRSEENANTQIAILREAGFEPELIAAPNGFIRVCAVTCSDMATASIKKDSIAGKFPGAWIARKKN